MSIVSTKSALSEAHFWISNITKEIDPLAIFICNKYYCLQALTIASFVSSFFLCSINYRQKTQVFHFVNPDPNTKESPAMH